MEEYERRLRWQCRRGLLELDIMLERFLDKCFLELLPQQRASLEALLLCGDIELWSWVSGRAECEDPKLAEIVSKIKEV